MIVPAGFYIASGDFRVFDAPSAILFPPQWGATNPPSYEAMANFLDENGANLGARALILPYPGEKGGEKFRPYSVNLFNQPEYSASTLSGPFFHQPFGIRFATDVVNYLVANRTDEIGVLLGIASVKYVLVDLDSNFTGSPDWQWNSLVGPPYYFAKLLNEQRDLTEICNCSGFIAYRNLDFRPYVQAYNSIDPFIQSQAQPASSHLVARLGMSIQNWSVPLPENRIANLSRATNGYSVEGANGTGSMQISFGEFNSSPDVSATTSRTGESGVLPKLTSLRNPAPALHSHLLVELHRTKSSLLQLRLRHRIWVQFNHEGEYVGSNFVREWAKEWVRNVDIN